MAATTLATSLSLIKDTVLQELVFEFFVKADPLIGRMPMVSRPGGGYRWRQEFVATSDAATDAAFYDTLSATAMTVAEYDGFLNFLYKMDTRNFLIDAHGEGQQGRSDRLTKKKNIIAEMSRLLRQRMVTGEPAGSGGAIGATLQALLGASATVEEGPRLFEFDDVHGSGGVSTTLGGFKWLNAGQTLQYKAPGDSYFGPKVVIDANNFYRVPLYSGLDSSNNPNPAKWCWVTCDPVATIMAAGDYESDTTAAKGITFTPSKQMTGLRRLCSPRQQVYYDLTGAQSAAGTTQVGNGPAAGGPVNLENMAWLRNRLLDRSNNDPSRCAIIVPENVEIHLENLLGHAGRGGDPMMWMGSELSGVLRYGNIPIFRNEFIPTNLTSRDGSRTDLTMVMGTVLGEDNFHLKYMPLSQEITNNQVSDVMGDMASAAGDGTPGGSAVPIHYEEQRAAANTQIVNQKGMMVVEPTAGGVADVSVITHVYNG